HRDLQLDPPPADSIRQLVGLRLDHIAQELLPTRSSLHAAWIERYRHNWIHNLHQDLELIDGAKEAVIALEAAGYLLAVATGKSRRGLDRDFSTTGLDRYFASSRTVDESPPKPSPGMLLELMDELGTRPERTLMVGDTTHDIEMANQAGVPSVGVLTGSHDRRTLEAHGTVVCLDRAADLPAWLAER
ncbi:MAG: HAD-IA family hydrolase, partial [Acidobacteriota bacterium]